MPVTLPINANPEYLSFLYCPETHSEPEILREGPLKPTVDPERLGLRVGVADKGSPRSMGA